MPYLRAPEERVLLQVHRRKRWRHTAIRSFSASVGILVNGARGVAARIARVAPRIVARGSQLCRCKEHPRGSLILVQVLAFQHHEVWAKDKVDEGWRYAPERDNDRAHNSKRRPESRWGCTERALPSRYGDGVPSPDALLAPFVPGAGRSSSW